MTQSPHALSVKDYKIDLPSYDSFVGLWLSRFMFSSANFQRFYLYFAILTGFGIWSARSQLWMIDKTGIENQVLAPGILIIIITIGALFGACLAAFAALPVMTHAMQIARYLSGPLPKQTHHLSINDIGIHKVSDQTTSKVYWEGVMEVNETTRSVLFFTHPNSAIIVPRTAFASSEDFSAFASAAKAYWERSKSAPLTSPLVPEAG